ncbi:MAG: alpha/beta fold hydrolase [Dehalococcoidia bacterium]
MVDAVGPADAVGPFGIEDRYSVVGGYRTHYVVAGKGPPILLVHGVGGSLLTYQHNLEELAVDARVYAIDLPGHGLSEIADGDYPAERGGTFVCSFIEEVIGGPAALVGVSAGGLMCILAAADRPELVTRLVLVSSAGFGRTIGWPLRLLTLPFTDRWVEDVSLDQARSVLEHQVYDPTSITPEFAEAEYRHWQRPGIRRAFLNGIRSNISLLGVRRWRRHLRRASILAVPVLIVWGRNDRTIGVKHAYRAAKRIAGARLAILDRCGHMAPYERPAEFNRVVRDFLA